VICCSTPRPFHAVGLHYRDFGEVDDATVTRVLAEARERVG
jgi:putative phosphoribosyl transferase